MSQGRAAAAVVGISLLLVAVGCGSKVGLPESLAAQDECATSDCDAGASSTSPGSQNSGGETTPSGSSFANPSIDGGETTGMLNGAACPGDTAIFPAASAISPPDVPVCCSNGFELGDATHGSLYTLASLDPAGAAAIVLDIDIATYAEADRVILTATNAAGVSTPVLDSCLLKTWAETDNTGGMSRPIDVAIRQFHADVPAGTTSLTFDFTGVTSPRYIRALGLCDFDVAKTSKAVSWREVASLADAGTCSLPSDDAGTMTDAAADSGADGSVSIR